MSATAAAHPGNVGGRRRPGRPSVAASFRPLILETLVADRQASTAAIFARARAAGYAAGHSAFYAMVATIRSEHGIPSPEMVRAGAAAERRGKKRRDRDARSAERADRQRWLAEERQRIQRRRDEKATGRAQREAERAGASEARRQCRDARIAGQQPPLQGCSTCGLGCPSSDAPLAPSPRGLLTLQRLWHIYAAANASRVRSIGTDRARARTLARLFGGDRVVATFNLEDVDLYRGRRRSETSIRKAAPSPASLNREVELLARVLAFAVSRKLLEENPLKSVEYLPEDNVREVVIGEELLTRILAACSPWLRAFVLVAFDSGMRRTESLRLKWSQIDLNEGLIRLSAAETKTRRARVAILSERAKSAIADLPRSPVWVFCNPETGSPFCADYATKTFRKTLTDAGITTPDGRAIWLHDLRRSFITNARRNGIPESLIMRMSGHRTASVFARYNILDESDIVRARDVLGGFHRPVPAEVARAITEAVAADNAKRGDA